MMVAEVKAEGESDGGAKTEQQQYRKTSDTRSVDGANIMFGLVIRRPFFLSHGDPS